MQRRSFLLGGAAAVTVGGATYTWLRAQGLAVDPPVKDVVLSPKESRRIRGAPYDVIALGILELLVLELLPGDSELKLPSGVESGVLDYLIEVGKIPGLLSVRNEILKLTRHLDKLAKAGGARFVERTAEERADIVRQAASDTVGKGRFVPERALRVCLRLSLEGYLGHSFHGGNREALVWEALKIDMPRDRKPGHHHG